MDPLSITVSVVTLIKVAGQASILLNQFCIDVGGINATLSGLLNDVAGFQQVLEGMKETFELEDIKANLTGHAGGHWENLARSLKDGEETLRQLTSLLEAVNKKTSFLDAPRKVARMKGAIEQIGMFREQIQSYRSALELSLSTIILSNQVTFQRSNEKVSSQILLGLDKLLDEFRRVGKSFNAQIEELQNKPDNQNEDRGNWLVLLKNLRECVRSAADVASTTSSTLAGDITHDENRSIKLGSDLGDVFPKEPDEMMLRWMSLNTINEDGVVNEPSTSRVFAEDYCDSDSDIETEMIRALFDSANKMKEDDELTKAESKLRNCLSLCSEKSARKDGVTRYEILEALVDTYWMMESWDKAKSTMAERMSISERNFGNNDNAYLWDTLKLAMLMMKCNEYVEAQLQCRRALQGFRRLKEPGFTGFEKSLLLLVEICSVQGKHDEQDAYATLLASHQAKQRAIKDQVEKEPANSPLIAPVPINPALRSAKTLLAKESEAPQEQAKRTLERTGDVAVRPDAPPHKLVTPPESSSRTVFGISLGDLYRRSRSAVPILVYQCILAVDLFGLESKGIYSKRSPAPAMQQLKALFITGSAKADFRDASNFQHDINAVADLLMHFFLELPEPVLANNFYAKFIIAAGIDNGINRRDTMHALVNLLPDTNYATLRALILHLHRVMKASKFDHITLTQLSSCWVPCLMGRPKPGGRSDAVQRANVFYTLLNNVLDIFDEV
ncbi:hypothetical protein FB567DRAFT_237932 [Paraphoma chrysanthemicola]|uniref:Rho-GAP domain-containing protein n=1 Tax=Paraphoma chrysanthemicola TaxID=798071 RepID=A0A8K0RE41_9PLEO|nr:hypothetical protein FB567DRAFT_237932 [Paraphoma chrysanthemicola]